MVLLLRLGNLLLVSEGFLAGVFVRLSAPIRAEFRHLYGLERAAAPAALMLHDFTLLVEFTAWLHHFQFSG
jgi:hypothetical protein